MMNLSHDHGSGDAASAKPLQLLRKGRSGVLPFLGLVMAFTALPLDNSRAACFEDGIGCTNDHYIPKSRLTALSCDALWTVRNTIYDEHGYCFRTARAKDLFSNEDCHVSNAADLNFNKYERGNIDRIVAVERVKGCR
jgi:hypothetical protein